MLTAEQLEEFHSSGIVCMRGAVARSAVEEMLRSVWSCLRDRCHIQRDEPDTWPEVDNLGVNQIIGVSRFTGSRHLPKAENFVQVGTAGIRDALDKIFGASPWQRPDRWGSLLVTFPESREAWDVPASGWHFDLPATSYSLGLTAVRVFTCLDKISHAGGATLVVAGSHRLVQNLVGEGERLHSHQARKRLLGAYPWIKALCSRDDEGNRIQRFMSKGAVVDGIDVRVLELSGDAGDIFLVHPMMLHAPSKNCATEPRLALTATIFRAGVAPVKLYP